MSALTPEYRDFFESLDEEELQELWNWLRGKKKPQKQASAEAWQMRKAQLALKGKSTAASLGDKSTNANRQACTKKGGTWKGDKCDWGKPGSQKKKTAACGPGEHMTYGQCRPVGGAPRPRVVSARESREEAKSARLMEEFRNLSGVNLEG